MSIEPIPLHKGWTRTTQYAEEPSGSQATRQSKRKLMVTGFHIWMREPSFALAMSESPVQQNTNNEFLTCKWGDCSREFGKTDPTSLAALALHLSEDHIGWKRSEYLCQWSGCTKKGTPSSHSRFSLLTHLRIHTGEKPFECDKANCGQSFGRKDALDRHQKAEHAEDTPTEDRRQPLQAQHQPSVSAVSRKRKTKQDIRRRRRDWSSDESGDSDPGESAQSKYKLVKAKLLYLTRDNERLTDELGSVQKKLRRLRTERRVLLDTLMTTEDNDHEDVDEQSVE